MNQLGIAAIVAAALTEEASSTKRVDRRHQTGTDMKTSRGFGKCKNRPTYAPQQLTDRRFMSRPQREAFDKGEEIWV